MRLISEVIKKHLESQECKCCLQARKEVRQEVSTYDTDISTLDNEKEFIIASTMYLHKYRTAHIPKMLSVINHKCF